MLEKNIGVRQGLGGAFSRTLEEMNYLQMEWAVENPDLQLVGFTRSRRGAQGGPRRATTGVIVPVARLSSVVQQGASGSSGNAQGIPPGTNSEEESDYEDRSVDIEYENGGDNSNSESSDSDLQAAVASDSGVQWNIERGGAAGGADKSKRPTKDKKPASEDQKKPKEKEEEEEKLPPTFRWVHIEIV